MPRLLGIFLVLPLLAVLAPTETPASESPVRLETSVSEKYYDIRGSGAEEIFASIQGHGLGGMAGLSASGLTESNLSYTISSSTDYFGCRLEDVSLDMKVDVTLPRHARPTELDPSHAKLWEAYEAQVEYHEYRHVEIEFKGLKELATELQRILPKGRQASKDCRSAIQKAVTRQMKVTRERHEKFHVEESRAVQLAQKDLASQIRDKDARIRDEKRALDETSSELEAIESEHAQWVREFEALIDAHGRELPPDAFDQAEEFASLAEALRAQSAELQTVQSAQVSRHNELVEERRHLARQLSWTR